MATSSETFSDWQNSTNSNLMTAAEELLDKLEDTSELLEEIDKKFALSNQDAGGGQSDDDHHTTTATTSIIQRFHEGVDSARDLVTVLKREKWRLSKRQLSVEMTMGELEDYKRHLKNDVSSLNQTMESLSLRMIQLENELAEAQVVRESLEAELDQHRNSLLTANDRNIQLYTENEDLKKATKELQKSMVVKENAVLKDEVHVLTLENHKLKDMVRDAEAKCPPFLLQRNPRLRPKPPLLRASSVLSVHKDDPNLARLRKEFLEELSSLELAQQRKAAAAAAAAARASGDGDAAVSVGDGGGGGGGKVKKSDDGGAVKSDSGKAERDTGGEVKSDKEEVKRDNGEVKSDGAVVGTTMTSTDGDAGSGGGGGHGGLASAAVATSPTATSSTLRKIPVVNIHAV